MVHRAFAAPTSPFRMFSSVAGGCRPLTVARNVRQAPPLRPFARSLPFCAAWSRQPVLGCAEPRDIHDEAPPLPHAPPNAALAVLDHASALLLAPRQSRCRQCRRCSGARRGSRRCWPVRSLPGQADTACARSFCHRVAARRILHSVPITVLAATRGPASPVQDLQQVLPVSMSPTSMQVQVGDAVRGDGNNPLATSGSAALDLLTTGSTSGNAVFDLLEDEHLRCAVQ